MKLLAPLNKWPHVAFRAYARIPQAIPAGHFGFPPRSTLKLPPQAGMNFMFESVKTEHRGSIIHEILARMAVQLNIQAVICSTIPLEC